ncbi:prepilin-type N-terminal cleavage/methylation domain-containing protein [Lysobacter sp. GX 14042]|uniref:prepilin-type N-terminal cleavage/methylation domain-containing protein n=1 Tax=Lysobacter sp. GX 14042 TaxID=2907155 RepID=UPI001F2069DF|nr:prepilin-type N-terminal cleavage/methylation domain-containing protein [Lysobacter sp. GX 14042]MCE7032754.1 prepilin-type N-terminal cleavage/methylation domain-containing protein [Lysobacter sp. GX 14042]
MIRRPPLRSRGFTLVEVLLATVLLAAGLALAFATLTAANGTVIRGERIASEAERMRAVEGFVRRRLAGARHMAFDSPAGEPPRRFLGAPDRVRFVADLPDYLGQGGPYLHDFRIERVPRRDGRVRLLVELRMVLAGQAMEGPSGRPPELLAGELRSAGFRYRGLDEDGEPGPWQEHWDEAERLPLMVELVLVGEDGRAWPPVRVLLPQAAAPPPGDNR